MPAGEIESAVVEQVRGILHSPEIIVRTWRVARQSLEGLREADVREALERLDPETNLQVSELKAVHSIQPDRRPAPGVPSLR